MNADAEVPTYEEVCRDLYQIGLRVATRRETREALRQRKTLALRLLLMELRDTPPVKVPRRLREDILALVNFHTRYSIDFDGLRGLPRGQRAAELARIWNLPAPTAKPFEDWVWVVPPGTKGDDKPPDLTPSPANHVIPLLRCIDHGGPVESLGYWGCGSCANSEGPCSESCKWPMVCGPPQVVDELVRVWRARTERLTSMLSRIEREGEKGARGMRIERSPGTPTGEEVRSREEAARWIRRQFPDVLNRYLMADQRRGRWQSSRPLAFPTPRQILARSRRRGGEGAAGGRPREHQTVHRGPRGRVQLVDDIRRGPLGRKGGLRWPRRGHRSAVPGAEGGGWIPSRGVGDSGHARSASGSPLQNGSTPYCV